MNFSPFLAAIWAQRVWEPCFDWFITSFTAINNILENKHASLLQFGMRQITGHGMDSHSTLASFLY